MQHQKQVHNGDLVLMVIIFELETTNGFSHVQEVLDLHRHSVPS